MAQVRNLTSKFLWDLLRDRSELSKKDKKILAENEIFSGIRTQDPKFECSIQLLKFLNEEHNPHRQTKECSQQTVHATEFMTKVIAYKKVAHERTFCIFFLHCVVSVDFFFQSSAKSSENGSL
jgi:hypothetical protein